MAGTRILEVRVNLTTDHGADLPERAAPAATPLAVGLPLPLYDELRRLARQYLRRERVGHTLQTTALAHEAFVRLAAHRDTGWTAEDRFAAAAARTIRRVLVDHARAAAAKKRGSGRRRHAQVDLSELSAPETRVDLVEFDECLRRLEALDQRQADVVELRFFAGLSEQRVADLLGVSRKTVQREWRWARAWLRKEFGLVGEHDPETAG